MADLYDLALAKMKLGVAVPIFNESFRYWDDPGTWANPTAWTKNGIVVARSFTEAFDGDEAAVAISDSGGIPDDDTQALTGAVARWWNDNRAMPTNPVVFYWSAAIRYVAFTGGTTHAFRFTMQFDDNQAFSSPGGNNTMLQLTTVDAAMTLRTGLKPINLGANERWARPVLSLRDATTASAVIDSLGVMMNPFNISAGYYQFTAFAETPSQRFKSYVEEQETTTGSTRRFDSSGGARKLQVVCQFDEEDLNFYEQIKLFWDINHGTPGLPGLPLLLEPNLPGYPPTLRCNMTDVDFPLDRQGARGSIYNGTVTFTAVDA